MAFSLVHLARFTSSLTNLLLLLLLTSFILTTVRSVPLSYTYTIDPIRYAFAPESARKWLYPDQPLNSGRFSRQLAQPPAPPAPTTSVNITIEAATTLTTTTTTTTTLMPSTTEIATTEKSSSSNEPLDTLRGCYHQGRFIHERSLIQPKDSCMNCTCANGIVQCQLTLCTLYRNIPDGCQLTRHESQCCPALECDNGQNTKHISIINANIPEFPQTYTVNGIADGSTIQSSTEAAATAVNTTTGLQQVSADDVIKQKQVQFQIPAGNDTTECKKNGFVYQNGDFVPSPDPCEACYCLRETVRCVTQRCELPEDTRQGCLPVYMDGICCPVRYQCGKTEQLTQSLASAALLPMSLSATTTQTSVATTKPSTTASTTTATTTTEMSTTTTTQKLPDLAASLADQRFELPRSDATFFHMDELKPMQRDTTNNITVIEVSHTGAVAAATARNQTNSTQTVITVNLVDVVTTTTTTTTAVPTTTTAASSMGIVVVAVKLDNTTLNVSSTEQPAVMVSDNEISKTPLKTIFLGHHETDPDLSDYALIEQDEPNSTTTSSPMAGTLRRQQQLGDDVERPLQRPETTSTSTSSPSTTTTSSPLTATTATEAYSPSTTPSIIIAFVDTPKAKAVQLLLEQKVKKPDVDYDESLVLEELESAIQAKALDAAALTAIFNQTRAIFEQAGHNRTLYQIPTMGNNITVTNETMEMMEMMMNSTTTEASTTTERNDTAYRVPIAGADILAMLENMTTTEAPENETMSTTTEVATSTERNDTAYRVPTAGADILAMLMNMTTGEGGMNETMSNETTVATTPSTTTVSTTPGIKMIIPLRSGDLHLSMNDGEAADIIITDRAEKPPSLVVSSTMSTTDNTVYTTATVADEDKLLFHTSTTTTEAPESKLNASITNITLGRPNSYLLQIADLHHPQEEQQKSLNQKIEQNLNEKLSSSSGAAGNAVKVETHNITINGTQLALNNTAVNMLLAASATTNLVLVKVNMTAASASDQKPLEVVEITTTSLAPTTSTTTMAPFTATTELETSAATTATTPTTTATTTTTTTAATTTTTESDFYIDINNKVHYRRPPTTTTTTPTITSTTTTTTTTTSEATTEATTVRPQLTLLNTTAPAVLIHSSTIAPLNVTVIAIPTENAAVSSQLVSTNLTTLSSVISSNASASTIAMLLPPTNQSSILLLKIANETVVNERIIAPVQQLPLETTTQTSDDDVVVPLRPNSNNRAASTLMLVVTTTTTTPEPTTQQTSYLTTEKLTTPATTKLTTPATTTESPHERAVALLAAEKAKEPDVEFDEVVALEQIESAIQEKALDAAALAAIFNQTRAIFEQAGHNRTLYQIPTMGNNITVTNETMEMMEMMMNSTTTEASTTTERNDTAYRVPIAGADILAMLENMTTTEAPENGTMSTTTELATSTERNDTAYRVPTAGADILAMLMNMTAGEGGMNETMLNETTVATTPSTTTVSTTPGIKMIIPLRMGEIDLTLNSSSAALQNITLGTLRQTALLSVAEVLNVTATTATSVTNMTVGNQTAMHTIAEQAGVQIVGVPLAVMNVTDLTTTITTEAPSTTTAQTSFSTSTTITTTPQAESTQTATTESTTTSTTEETTTTTKRHKTLIAAGVPSTTQRPSTTTILAPITIDAVRGRQRGSLTRIVSLEPTQDGRKVTVKSQINLGDKTAIGGCLLDGQLYSNYQAIPLAELRDPCIVHICKDGVIYGPSMQRCPSAIDGCLPTQVVGVCCPVYLCPPIIERNDNSTTLSRPLGSAESLFVMNETSAAQLSRNYVCRINSRFLTLNERVIRVAQDKCQTCECKQNGIVCEPGCGKNQLISSPDLIGELALGLSVNLDVNQHSIKADTPPPLTTEQLQQQTTSAPSQQQVSIPAAPAPAANALLADAAGGIAGQRGCQIKDRYYKHGENIDFGDECHSCTCYDSLVNCRINKDKCNALVRRRRRFDFMSNFLLVRPIDNV